MTVVFPQIPKGKPGQRYDEWLEAWRIEFNEAIAAFNAEHECGSSSTGDNDG